MENSTRQQESLKNAAEICKDELPIEAIPQHDKVAEFMTEGGQGAISKAKAVMKSAGVDEKCIEIFGIVCAKAQEFGVLDIVREACANLWV